MKNYSSASETVSLSSHNTHVTSCGVRIGCVLSFCERSIILLYRIVPLRLHIRWWTGDVSAAASLRSWPPRQQRFPLQCWWFLMFCGFFVARFTPARRGGILMEFARYTESMNTSAQDIQDRRRKYLQNIAKNNILNVDLCHEFEENTLLSKYSAKLIWFIHQSNFPDSVYAGVLFLQI